MFSVLVALWYSSPIVFSVNCSITELCLIGGLEKNMWWHLQDVQLDKMTFFCILLCNKDYADMIYLAVALLAHVHFFISLDRCLHVADV